MPGGVVSLSSDLRILSMNRVMRALVGGETDDLAGQPFDRLLTTPSRILFQTHVYPALALDGVVEEVFLTLASRDGSPTPILLNVARDPTDGSGGPNDSGATNGSAASVDTPTYVALAVRIRARARWQTDLLTATRAIEREQRRITVDRDRLDLLTTTDPLTKLGNRRRLEADLAQRIAAASASEPVAVVFADIDHFKAINDELGHTAGDDVLRFVSDLLGATCRADDVVSRYGGEEFVAVLPRTDLDGAVRWGERARSTLAARRVPELGHAVTASFGVAEHRPGESADDLLARADAALYAAKSGGRDRVARATAVGEAAPTVVEPAPPDRVR